MSETEGMNLEGRGREILQGMKGWRPSALPRLDAGSGLVKGAYHMPDVGSIGLSFREVPVPGPRIPFRAHRLATAESDKQRPSVRDLENGASPSPRSKRPEELEMKTTATTHELMRTGSAAAARCLL